LTTHKKVDDDINTSELFLLLKKTFIFFLVLVTQRRIEELTHIHAVPIVGASARTENGGKSELPPAASTRPETKTIFEF
jgi:hypothetical protein